MSELIENQCPNCSATIKFDSKLKIMKCPYCDSEFRLSGTTVQDEVASEISNSVYQKEYPNYDKMYHAVCAKQWSEGLIVLALIVLSIGFIILAILDIALVTLGYIGLFCMKLATYNLIISLIVNFFCFFRINQLKDPRYNHEALILSIESQILYINDPLNHEYSSQHDGTFYFMLLAPILLAIIF